MGAIINTMRTDLTYVKEDLGIESWYDDNNNCIYRRYPNGTEICNTYDSNNNIIRSKNSMGYSIIFQYDSNGDLIDEIIMK